MMNLWKNKRREYTAQRESLAVSYYFGSGVCMALWRQDEEERERKRKRINLSPATSSTKMKRRADEREEKKEEKKEDGKEREAIHCCI